MARQMMSGSDWYILRRLEMGLDSNAAVPASITNTVLVFGKQLITVAHRSTLVLM